MRKSRLVSGLLFFLALRAALFGQQNSAPQKYALVIGNGAYTSVARLSNPVNDANDMKAALEALGFQVELLTNAALSGMEEGVIRLGRRLSQGNKAYGFFFYAGHGVQSQGENYLIPVDADIKSESFLRTKALVVQAVLDELQGAGNELNMIVLDACRDNPFGWARSGSRGLTVTGRQPPGSIVVYATSAGSTAADGAGRNGLFTGQLLQHLKTPGLEVSEIFRRTGAAVSRTSQGGQIPAIYSQFFEPAYLSAAPAQPAAPIPAAPAAGQSRPVAARPPERPAPDTGQIAGTKWSLVYSFDDTNRSYEIEFLDGGILKSNVTSGANNFWEQSGDRIVFHFNNKYVTYEGRLSTGGVIRGTAKNIAGNSWEFECRKR
jgi:hypothetical protein